MGYVSIRKMRELASKGLSYTSMSEELGKKRGSVLYLLNKYNLHGFWETMRRKSKLQKEIDQFKKYRQAPDFHRGMLQVLFQKAREEGGPMRGWALEMAMRFCFTTKYTDERQQRLTHLEDYVTFYLRYNLASQQNLSIGVRQLRQGMSISCDSYAYQMLQIFELPALGQWAKGSQASLDDIIPEPFWTIQQKGDWASSNAARFCFSRRSLLPKRLPIYESYHTVLERYHKGEMSNRKPSIRQLREGTELMSESAVTTLLNYVGKKPLRRTPLKLENEEIERILRGYDLNMSYNDIGHFVQRNPRLVQEIFLKHKPRPRSTHILARVPLGDGQHKVLMPWQASVIYQAQHEGMSDADISKTLDLPMAAVEYAMQKRSSIEPDIIHALNVFYPEQKHELPFLVTTSARGA